MGRRWTTNQYMARRLRRMERRAFNRMWSDITHPPSASGTRKCVDCACNLNCSRNRKGNHQNCFRANPSYVEKNVDELYNPTETEPIQISKKPSVGFVLLVCAIIAVIFIGISLLFKVNGLLGCIVMVLFIFFVISR